MKFSITLLLFFASMVAVDSARILGVFHVPFYSHYRLGDKILKELAARGHEVTVITPFPEKKVVKNFKQILLTDTFQKMEAAKEKLFEQTENDVISRVVWLEAMGFEVAERALNHTNVRQLLSSNAHFDLVILHQFMNEAFKGFCHRYKAPCVVLSPMPTPQWTHDQVGNPDCPAYVPDMYLRPSNDTNFWERFRNSLVYLGVKLFTHLYALPRQNGLLQTYFDGAPHLHDLYYNTSLVLVNSHVSINPALPHVPNMIEIGGFHIDLPKEVPGDLKEYLDSATEGAIFFSLGSNLKSKDLPKDKLKEILKSFSKLKQKVLWKWEDETLPGQPDNVKVGKWFPQQDVLAHPNIKLFITHGGLLSTIEAIYHGVPVIGMPVFGDQQRNVAIAEVSGYGIGISYKNLTEETFSNVLKEILNNPKYSENAQRRSKIMHDDPVKPLDKAIFWIEYVIRHQGAVHLRSAALNLKWYEYLNLDVLLLVFIITFTVLYVIVKLIKIIACKIKLEAVSKGKKIN